MTDYYGVLGVPRTATKDEIKKAYRKAALRTHPDRAPADQKKKAEDGFRAVNAAYEILHDDANRSLYDKHGSWPPPPPPPPKNSFATRPRDPPEYKPFNPAAHQPVFDGGAHHHFAFTDPFALFNMIFADLFPAQIQVPFPGGRPHSRAPVPPGMFADPSAAFVPQQPFMQPSFAQAANQFVHTAPNGRAHAPAAVPPPEPVATQDSNGWIKESKVTKMTPQGTRETTVKKTAPDGTVYTTRVGGDGVERHYITVNGVEKRTSTPPPRTPPRVPLTQTQAQTTPPQARQASYPSQAPPPLQRTPSRAQGHSSRHAPSASQPVNTAHPSSTSHPQGHPSANAEGQTHRRSSSRAPIFTTNYRAASPPPMHKGEGAPAAAYPAYAYAQTQAAGPSHRASSPLPGTDKRTSRVDPRSAQPDALRRNHTAPMHIYPAQAQAAQAQAPMPRPQSPHFYRSRSTSEHKHQQEVTAKTAAPTAHRTRALREEEGIYVFSDSEGVRGRSNAHRPSRSSQTFPVPVPVSGTNPTSDRVRTSSQTPEKIRVSAYPHLQPQAQAIVMEPATPSINNELGLGFVPPPSAGLGPSHRNSVNSTSSGRSAPANPLGGNSRNGSFDEIVVYPYGQARKQKAHAPVVVHGMAYGNPIPNPPTMRDPWVGAQQPVYRQVA